MELTEIFKNVCEIIERSTGIEKDSIKMESTLFEELGVDSIDLVDILFELETFYEVELKVSDIESRAKEELGDIPYEIDGVITAEGLEAIRRNMTEVDPAEIKEGLTVHRLVQLFTVHSLCKIVLYRLEMKEQ